MLLIVDPKSLMQNPWNPNKVDPINQEKLQKSMELDGQKMPILVREIDEGFQIIDGAHRVMAAIALGINVTIYNVGRMTDAAAKKATLVANSRYGSNDPEALLAIFQSEDFENAEAILSTLPIDESEIRNLFAAAEVEVDFEAMEDKEPVEIEEPLMPPPPPAIATHKIVRFKLPIDFAETLTAKLDRIIQIQNISTGDKLVDVGEALASLIQDGDIQPATLETEEGHY